MPKQITLLRVFVASPGDLGEERAALETIIRDMNITLFKTRQIQMNLIKWETHAYPSVGETAQSVISEQIGDDYDIFIGILWKTFGTPTDRAGSGTEEEFNRAYERFRNNPDELRVMFYFNQSPVPLNEMDPNQLILINKFRDELGDRGVLYWTYTGIDEFTSLIHLHLAQHIADFGDQWATGVEEDAIEIIEVDDDVSAEEIVQTSIELSEVEEEGFLDMVEAGTEGFEATTSITRNISAIVEELGMNVRERTIEIEQLTQPIDVKQAKRISNRIAEDMEHFAVRMNAEVPILADTYNSAASSYARASELWLDFGIEDKSDIQDALDTIRNLKDAISTSNVQISEFKSSIYSLPRLTTRYNRARKLAIASVDDLLNEMERMINLTTEVEKTMENILSTNNE